VESYGPGCFSVIGNRPDERRDVWSPLTGEKPTVTTLREGMDIGGRDQAKRAATEFSSSPWIEH
jgi:hypothetical protein